MKNRWHTLIAVLALGVFTSIADASPPPRAPVFPPVDQAARDPAFLDFLENLRTLVRARDADAVAAHADPDIKLSFGGAYGRESFHQSLSENPTFGGASYWQELQRVLDLGGVFDAPDAFCTPYIFCLPIPDCATCDPYETLVAVEANAPIHAAPDAGSKIVATVSYAVVTMIDNTHYPWSRVRVPGEATPAIEGYVSPPHSAPPSTTARISRCSTTAAG